MFIPYSISPAMILGALLALSVAGNVWLFNSRDAALEKKGAMEAAYVAAAAAAGACSASVEQLAADGARRHEDILRRLAAQSGQVTQLKKASIEALNARPSDPADLCASLEAWLRTEIVKGKGVGK